MNVTLKISDELLRQARHQAVDQNLSLSAWTASLIERELGRPAKAEKKSLLDRLGDDRLADIEIELPARSEPISSVEW